MPGSLGAGAMKFKAYAEANGVDPSVYVGIYDAAALIMLQCVKAVLMIVQL